MTKPEKPIRENQLELLAVIRREKTGKTLVVSSKPFVGASLLQAGSDTRRDENSAYSESQPLAPRTDRE